MLDSICDFVAKYNVVTVGLVVIFIAAIWTIIFRDMFGNKRFKK